jgi:transglutaminase-like putative cysteine protease
MNKITFLVIALLAGSLSLRAASDPFYPVFVIPDSLMANANEVVREEITEFKVESLRAGTFTYRKVVTILNGDSRAQMTAVFYDKDSRIRRFQANLYDALGNLIRKIDKDEIKDYSAVADFSIYQDDRVQVLDIRHSHYPYTVEVEYEMRLEGSRYCNYPIWDIQEFGTSVEKSRFIIDLPAGMKFHYQAVNLDIEPRQVKDGNRDVFTWEVARLKALRTESRMPPGTQFLPRLITSPDAFQWDKYQGSMASWEAYGKFMGQLFKDRDQLPEETAATIRQLVADTDDIQEKIQRLYRFMQENMRYVSVQLGIGGWQPFDAAYVSEKRYGDCKALSNFMKSMLQEVGITAYPALIYNGDLAYEVQPDFTTPRFNHMILYVPDEDLWLECTSSTFPPGYIGQSNSNRNALLVTPEGGHLQKTPIYGEEDNVEAHWALVDIKAEGEAEIQVKSHYKGADHELYRSLKNQLPDEEQRKWLIKQQATSGFSLKDYSLSYRTDRPESDLAYSAAIGHFAQKAGKRLFVPIKPISPAVSIPPKNEHRRYPIFFSRDYCERDTVVLRFPEGYQLESKPGLQQELDAGFGQYQSTIELDEGQVTFTRELRIRAGQLPPEVYEDYREFYKAIAKADGTQLVLRKVE